jgi:hypothetical protein
LDEAADALLSSRISGRQLRDDHAPTPIEDPPRRQRPFETTPPRGERGERQFARPLDRNTRRRQRLDRGRGLARAPARRPPAPRRAPGRRRCAAERTPPAADRARDGAGTDKPARIRAAAGTGCAVVLMHELADRDRGHGEGHTLSGRGEHLGRVEARSGRRPSRRRPRARRWERSRRAVPGVEAERCLRAVSRWSR